MTLTAQSRAGVPRPASFQAPAVPKPAPPPEPIAAPTGNLKQDLQDALRIAGMAFSADAVGQADVELRGGDLLIKAPKTMLMALRDAGVQRIASQLTGKPIKLKVEAGENMAVAAPTPVAEPADVNSTDMRERALSHPGVKRFQELFPGALIRDVRNLNE